MFVDPPADMKRLRSTFKAPDDGLGNYESKPFDPNFDKPQGKTNRGISWTELTESDTTSAPLTSSEPSLKGSSRTPFKSAGESGRVHIDLSNVQRAEFSDLNVMLDLMSIWSAQIQPSIKDSHEYASAQQAVLDDIKKLAASVVKLKRFH
jgi:hypothetical protein